MTKGQLVRIIHVAKGKLRLDDDTYRQLLSTVTGKTSTRDMTVPQLNNVLNAMKKRGFKIQPAKKADSTRPLDDSPQSKKSGRCGWKWQTWVSFVTVQRPHWRFG